jgi:hypothetical protein
MSEVVLSGAIFLSRLIGRDDTFCFEEDWKGLDFIGVERDFRNENFIGKCSACTVLFVAKWCQ